MPWHMALTQLYGALAQLYPAADQARQVAARSGLAGERLAAPDHPAAAWRSVLEEAEREGKVQAVIDAALALAREAGDGQAEGPLLNALELAFLGLGQFERAAHYGERWLLLALSLGDRRGQAGALVNLGAVYQRSGDLERAIGYRERGLGLMRDLGDRAGEGAALAGLASSYHEAGYLYRAAEAAQSYLAIVRESGDRRLEGAVLLLLGGILGEQGRVDEALPVLERPAGILERMEDPKGRVARDTLRALRWEAFKRDAAAS